MEVKNCLFLNQIVIFWLFSNGQNFDLLTYAEDVRNIQGAVWYQMQKVENQTSKFWKEPLSEIQLRQQKSSNKIPVDRALLFSLV